MQPHLMHNLIHDKRGTCHVTGVFHKRYAEIKNKDVRQKDNHTTNTTNNAVYQQVFQWSVRHIGMYKIAEGFYQPLNTHHRVFAEHERPLEHKIHEQEENGESPHTVRYNGVYHTGSMFFIQMIIHKGFFQRTGYKTIFSIGNCLIAILIQHVSNTATFLITDSNDFFAIG